MRKFALVVFLSAAVIFSSGTLSAGDRRVGSLPAPEIISPTENTAVSADGLEFRWSMGARPDYTDFRLYKGTETVEKNLIMKEKVGNGKSTFLVPASAFENGATYAWSVKLVGSRKGRSVYALFTVREGGTHAVQTA
jgi:hypothetical protein